MSTVVHPDHYGGDVPTEPIKVIRAWGLNFALGNAVKYLSRAGRKDPAKKLEDLSKAIFYVEDEIQRGEHSIRTPVAPISKSDLIVISKGLSAMAETKDRNAARVLIDELLADVARGA